MMKKKIFGIAALVLALSISGFSASARTSCDNNSTCSDTNCAPAQCSAAKQSKDCCAKKPSIFDGLDLTDAQKQQLKALDDKFAADRKALAEKTKAEKVKAGDDIRKARQEARRKYLADVKSVIGDKKYVEFLENYYLNTPSVRHAKNARHDVRKAGVRSKDVHRAHHRAKKHDRHNQVKADQN